MAGCCTHLFLERRVGICGRLLCERSRAAQAHHSSARSLTMPHSIQVPSDIVRKWQEIVDLLAAIAHVPSALIMRVEPPYIKVFVSSESKGNPYERPSDARAPLRVLLYDQAERFGTRAVDLPIDHRGARRTIVGERERAARRRLSVHGACRRGYCSMILNPNDQLMPCRPRESGTYDHRLWNMGPRVRGDDTRQRECHLQPRANAASPAGRCDAPARGRERRARRAECR
jgi:hypothetical protein